MMFAIMMLLAHSWYPVECCSEKDCEPLKADEVRDLPEGYLFPNGQTVPNNLTRQSRDGQYHWCRIMGTNIIIKSDDKYCVFIPHGTT